MTMNMMLLQVGGVMYLVRVPNIALLSSVGLLESYPILDTTIPVIGNPFEMILELLNNAISDGDFKVYFLPLH